MQLSEAILFDLSWLFFGGWAIVLLASTWAVFGKDFFTPGARASPDQHSPDQQLAPSPAKISSTKLHVA